MFLWWVRDGWRDSERGLLLPISSGGLRVPRSTANLCILSKSDRVVPIMWSPSSYTPVRPECPDRAVLFTNQNVTACQAHMVTRNEPKIHGICYITQHDNNYLMYIKNKFKLLMQKKNPQYLYSLMKYTWNIIYEGVNVVWLADKSNKAATRAFAFMLSSVFSKYKNVEHVVPTKCLKA